MAMKKVLGSFLSMCLISLSVSTFSVYSAQAGPLDCFRAKKYSSYSKLRTSYFKAPEKKTDQDWFRAYTFATIFNGYPNCFNKKDVAVMRDFIKIIDDICYQNRNFGTICRLTPVRGPMANWAYDSYK
jgi:hypothetical protein